MARKQRTDVHRPGAIVPADYRYVFSYQGPTTVGGWPEPSFGINCELDRRVVDPKTRTIVKNGEHDADGRCCVVGLLHVAKVEFAQTGGTNRCSVCSTHFVYGDVWEHVPTGEHVHVGHNCAAKYEMLADRSAFELAQGRRRAAAATEITKHKNAEERAKFLTANPGLEAALELGIASRDSGQVSSALSILSDLAGKLVQYRSFSSKQVALALKLAEEVKNPRPPRPEEVKVDAPTGRVTFRGRVVSVKSQEGDWGTTTKIAVKVQTPAGAWVAWGTAPRALLDETVNHDGALRGPRGSEGTEVEITATLSPGREKGFALMKRPNGRVVALACGGAASCKWCQEQVAESFVAFVKGCACTEVLS
jgi:hypothetical protein